MPLLCDGKKDGPDSTDEVFSACYNVLCSGFRCNYGGCIDASLKCNNINDCWDKSDENKFLCANETTILELLTDLSGNCACLHWSNVCDGVGDCRNGEDEDKNICGVNHCASGSF
ncbi:uncharacterized protein Dmoj_GI16928 [Drosophila mojavensis]|uniref:Uncharacterized protein n=1 Tax=Drosophila mojavensis TaxID=7230 RepID=B4K6N9_DROMO|nr:uncharacterized protein Dmoj_GI16928 [Drosophila mojavensis]